MIEDRIEVLALSSVLWLCSAQAPGEDAVDELARWIPDSSVLYLEGPGLAPLLEQGLGHPLVATLLDSELGRALLAKASLQPEAALDLADEWFGRPVLATLAELTSRGLTLSFGGVEGATGWTLLLQGENAELLRASLQRVFERIAEQKGFPASALAQPHDHSQGVQQWFLGEDLCIGLRGPILVATNQRPLLQASIELLASRAAGGLAQREAFALARASRSEDTRVWGWADFEALDRLKPGGTDKLRSLARNPAVHFLLGPALALSGTARRAAFELHFEEDRLALEATAFGVSGPALQVLYPATKEDAQGTDGLGFSPAGGAAAVLYRDLAGIFAARGKLFPVGVLPKFSEAISNLSFLFGGQDLSEEILPALSPWLELIVAEPEFRAGAAPEIPRARFSACQCKTKTAR
jgi:hypothetical protein